MMKLKKLNETNYKEYRRCLRRIEYSFAKNGEISIFSGKVDETMDLPIRPYMLKHEFIEEVNKDNTGIYCLQNDKDEIIGFAILKFNSSKQCIIPEFAVFEKLKGLGTEFYKMLIEEVIRPRVREIHVLCPFEGAQAFWEKMGLNVLQKNSKKSFFNPYITLWTQL